VDWRYLFRNYKAAVDYPCSTFYQELMEEFPNAKVLLSVRDPEKWYCYHVNPTAIVCSRDFVDFLDFLFNF
jgi:hypothetical protein